MIKIEKLCKNYDKLEVLKGIDAQVNKGDIIAIIGPSGSGKSTFLRCINKLEEPTSGHIYIKNQDIMSDNTDINLIRQKVGMVFQHFNLFPHKTSAVFQMSHMYRKMTRRASACSAVSSCISERPRCRMRLSSLTRTVRCYRRWAERR